MVNRWASGMDGFTQKRKSVLNLVAKPTHGRVLCVVSYGQVLLQA